MCGSEVTTVGVIDDYESLGNEEREHMWGPGPTVFSRSRNLFPSHRSGAYGIAGDGF